MYGINARSHWDLRSFFSPLFFIHMHVALFRVFFLGKSNIRERGQDRSAAAQTYH
jgi:hypothetical protein